VALAGLALLAGGCAKAESAGGTQGFVSGSGAVSIVDAADRRPAPEVRGETLSRQPLALSDFAGQVVVVNVWGSWCPPCRAEAPDLAAAARRLAGADVAFLGINFRDTLPPNAIPSTLVIDADGDVAARVLGPVEASTLVGLVRDVLAGR
jgi:thiol-disulfide isomerase/thioredoxin